MTKLVPGSIIISLADGVAMGANVAAGGAPRTDELVAIAGAAR